MPKNEKEALLTYRQRVEINGEFQRYTKLCFVITLEYINRYLKKICELHSLKDSRGKEYYVTSHQFRHNGITDRLASGFTIAQIKEITDHHGDAMIYKSYNHLNLQPETIIKQQQYLHKEKVCKETKYILFAGRILNMDEQLEKRLMKNPRAHQVRGGICSDITGCRSEMLNCLICEFFVIDAEQIEYYEGQVVAWREKALKFKQFPMIKNTADSNAELYVNILKRFREVNSID